MNTILNQIRLKLFLLTRTLGYTQDYADRLYQIYLNHSKIIHFRDGYPVYSLSTPALYSKPSANMFARLQYGVIQNRNLPNLMSFAVNDDCNAACEHCSFFSGVADNKKEVLSLKECQEVIRQGQELGASVINIVGGEPLMRQDLPEIISSIDPDLSTSVVFTNGRLLKQKAKDLKAAGLDSIYISIDASKPKLHDAIRRSKGLFDTAIEGVRYAQTLGFSTGISTCITPEAYQQGEFENIIRLGKKIGVHEVLFFDALPTGRYQKRKDLIDNNQWVEDMIAKAKPFNQDPSYPGVILFPYMTSHRSVGCSCGTSYFYVSPYGDIMSCDFNHAIFGNIRQQPLYQIWDNLTSKKEFQSAKWGGCKVKSSQARKSKHVDTTGSCCG